MDAPACRPCGRGVRSRRRRRLRDIGDYRGSPFRGTRGTSLHSHSGPEVCTTDVLGTLTNPTSTDGGPSFQCRTRPGRVRRVSLVLKEKEGTDKPLGSELFRSEQVVLVLPYQHPDLGRWVGYETTCCLTTPLHHQFQTGLLRHLVGRPVLRNESGLGLDPRDWEGQVPDEVDRRGLDSVSVRGPRDTS